MWTFKSIKELKLGGTADTLALLGLGLGAMTANPFFAGKPIAQTIGALLAAGSGIYLGSRYTTAYRDAPLFPSPLELNSSEPPMEWMEDKPTGGFLLGYTVDTGKPLVVPYEEAMQHFLITGQSGVGKTVLGRFMMLQQIMEGGCVLFVDGKMNGDDIQMMYNYCCWAGRPQDFMVINPGKPEDSNTYNPILFGDPDEISSRILSLIPSTESNAGADYYKQSGNQGISTIVAALQKAGYAYNFIDLSILLMNQRAITYLETLVPEGSPEKTNLSLFLDQYRVAGKDNKMMLDMKRLKETFGGVGGRLFMFGSNKFGSVTNTYSPDVNLFDAIMGAKVIYMPLPTMGKDIAAQNFGKMEIGDLRTAVSWVQALPEEKRPWPPVLAFFDEAGSYVNASWARMFEQARSAKFCLCPAIQTAANFEAVSPELASMITGNTWTKMFFKIAENDTAKKISDLIGKEMRVTSTLSVGGSSSQSSQKAKPGGSGSDSSGVNIGISEKIDEVYKVTSDNLKSLAKGEAIVMYGGKDVYHIKIPLVYLDADVTKQIGPLRINKYRRVFVRGISLFQKAKQFLSTTQQRAVEGGSEDGQSEKEKKVMKDLGGGNE